MITLWNTFECLAQDCLFDFQYVDSFRIVKYNLQIFSIGSDKFQFFYANNIFRQIAVQKSAFKQNRQKVKRIVTSLEDWKTVFVLFHSFVTVFDYGFQKRNEVGWHIPTRSLGR